MTNARSFSLFESSLKRGKKQQTTITINDSRPEESILNYALRGLKNGVRLKRQKNCLRIAIENRRKP